MRQYSLYFVFFALIGAITMAPFTLSAQNLNTSEGTPEIAQPEPAPIKNTFKKVPDEYIEEAMRFNTNCVTDYNLQQYYNCDCLAMAYLDRRINNGGFVSASAIKLDIMGECRDARNAAGPVYQNCIKSEVLFSPGMDPEKYCECVANTYVRLFDRDKPLVDSKSTVSYNSQAYFICKNPNQAQKLFQYNPR